MTVPMNISFTPNRSDYIKTLRAFTFTRPFTILLLVISIGLLISSIFGLLVTGFSIWWFLAFILSFALPWSILFTSPIIAAENAASNSSFGGEVNWKIEGDKVSIHKGLSGSTYDWVMFGETLETREHYFVCMSTNKNCYHLIPKRAFVSAEQETQFRALLNEKGHTIRRITSINLPEPSRKKEQLIIYGTLIIVIIILVVFGFLEGLRQGY
jgi:hypothetical protein